MWKFVRGHEFYLGTLITIFCVVWMVAFFDNYNWFVVLPLGVSWLGLICLFDFFDRKYFAHTIIPDTVSRKKKMYRILLVGLVFCTVLEIFFVFIGRLWYYPFWSLKVYLLAAPFAYGAYTLLLFILYEFVKDAVLRYKKIQNLRVSKNFYKRIMVAELWLGIAGFTLSTYYALRFLFDSRLSSFLINQKSEVPASAFFFGVMVFVSTFFIFEYWGSRQNKQTLTHDILAGNLWPIVFILIANLIAVIIIEFLNGPFQVWIFANWPYDNLRMLNIPLTAILVWPLQFPVFLSMIRVLFPAKEAVW